MARKKKKSKKTKLVLAGLAAFSAVIYIFFDPLSTWVRRHSVECLGAAAVVLLLVFFRAAGKHRLASSLKEIDAMDGHEFERFLGRLFSRMGYRAQVVGASGSDFGADLIIEKDGVPIAVQAKNYDSGKVGNDAVQQVIAGTTYYDCKAALVVTNSFYTKAAVEQARKCAVFPVTLWNRRDLEKVLFEQPSK